ncbi:MAG: TetR/AcrR family transcriptional regulator [Cellulosilyticaceae bacterium]
MGKETYHHGTLKETLIQKGLQLINEEGIEGFSLRKVAALCGVSHTAPYKHFKNKEELLGAICLDVSQQFSDYLMAIAKQYEGPSCMVEMGKAYVRYMVENKECYSFMFISEMKLKIVFQDGQFSYEDYSPFGVFHQAATQFFAPVIPNERIRNIVILNMFSQVQGIATLLINETIRCEEDIEALVEEILTIQNVIRNKYRS